MISLEMCQRYGMDSEKELMTAIEELRKIGMSEIAIQAISTEARRKGRKNDRRRSESKVDLLSDVR